jgi:NAD(P)-dependent dehydrogenase (short-subunit alcohol dehydrogenase family)
MTESRKTVLVTGAASGIGLACVEALLAAGDNVCGADLDAVPAERLPGGSAERFIEARTDVSDPAQCGAAVKTATERFGRLDALIHMAAAHSTRPWRELDADHFNRIMAVNVTGAFLMAQAAAEAMQATGGGAIVLACSGSINVSGLGGNGRGGPAYVASKGAIIGLTRALARSFAPLKVRVNAVSPGSTRTAMTSGYSEAALRNVGERTLTGRIGEPEEIASVARFLISDAASYVWGEIVNVNGGGSFGL